MVVGGGQAGLATSYWLSHHQIDHVVIDRGRVGDSWRHRWDSFTLVTPNWMLNLPGHPYEGSDPDDFLPRDKIVEYVEGYREMIDAPLVCPVEVERVSPMDDGWRVVASSGTWDARSVVVAAGSFQIPSRPGSSELLASDVAQVHSQDYRRPSDLAEGAVLVVGSAQSGCQIVDDLQLAGREVWLSVGGAGRAPRRYRGKDTTVWFRESGLLDTPIDELPDGPDSRFSANPHVSGRDGGKDLNLRGFGRDGVRLVGRFVEANGHEMRFADDLIERLDGADRACSEIQAGVDRFIEGAGIEAPPADVSSIEWTPQDMPQLVDLMEERISTVVWATGYRRNYSWIDAPVIGERNYPRQTRGVTEMPGLYFVGLHGMYTLSSSLFWGMGADAQYVVEHIVENSI